MARFLDNKKDIDKQVKKKKKEETAAKKPQSSSASADKVNKRLSEKYSGGSTGGKVSKPSRSTDSQSRITQKSYGTTKPTITQRTTSGSTAQRQQNAERNNNLKQTMGQQARENRISRLEEERQQRQAQQEKARRTTGAVNRRLSQKYGENQVTGGRRTKLDSAADYTRDVAKGAWQGAKLAATEDAAFLNRFSNESSGNKFWNRELNEEDYEKNMRRMELRQEGWRKKIKDQQEAMQRTAEESHGRLGRLGIEAAQSAGGMAVDAMFGPFSLVHMGARVTEGAQGDVIEKAEPLKERMRQAGYSEEEINERFKGLERADFANAIMQGTIEGLTEKMFGGIGLAAKVGGRGYLDRAIGKLAGGRLGSGIAGRVARGTLEEIAEEEVGNPAQALASNVIYGNKFQGINEDIARRSLDELMAASANVDSEDFYKEARNAFKESGSSDEEANELAEMARRYLQAQLSGDSETAQTYQDQMVKRLTGGENSLKEKWTLQDAIDVGLSTAMMTVATGVPGALTTAAIGSTYKEENGLDGVRKLTEVVKNLDPDNSTKAQAILDRIDAGEDISNTQVYDIMDLSSKAAAKAKEREAVKNRLSARQMQEEDLLVQPAVITRAGYQLGVTTEQRFEEISDRVLDRVGEGSEDSYTIADAVAAYETGTITAEQMNALNVENPENRTVFQEMTGIDLNQFNVTDRSGNIDEAASNTKMQTALFANAAENYVQSARIEQENWNDKVRGMTAEAMSPGLGGEGDKAFQKAMESVDPRDRAKFMLTDAAARRVYEYARNTTDEWSDVRRDFRSMFKGVDESVLRDVFDAAKKDKTVAETQYYGQIVNRNSLTSDVAFTAGKFRNESQRPLGNKEMSTLSTIASELGVDVIMSDALDANENGRYSPKQRTITLNAANSMGDNLSFVFSHEVTHHLAAYAPDEYIKLSRFIMDTWYKNNEAEYNAEIGKIQKLYKEKKDQDLSPEQALEEIIANNAHNFWADEEFVDAVTKNEPTLAQSIINAIREFLRKLRNILSSETITDERTREGLFAEIGAYDEAYRMWLAAFNAAKKARANEAIEDLQERIYEEESTRHSINDADYMAAVERGDSIEEKDREALNAEGIEELDDGTTARYSLTSWEETNKDKKLKALVEAGHNKDIAGKWIDDINSIASIIFADRERLDYEADRSNKFLKPNGDYYKYTLDASTLCDKRRIYQGTYNAIQHVIPDAPLMQEDVVRIRTLLKEKDHKAPCGICYVESQRKNLGQYAKEWYDSYARKDEIQLADVTTSDGLKELKKTNPEVAADFEKAMAAKGVSSPKVVKLRTDYREDIMRMRPATVEYLNSIGGLRFHSFSDFETVHLIDTMQAVMDMSAKGLMGMAYAKVPNFAAVFGPTGIKINLSLIAKTDENGNALHDENGRLLFDSVEGIPYEEASKWRDAYPDNVAFILVGKDKEHTLEAINDDRVDFVIPFHRSKWSAEDMRRLGLVGYEDFATGHQENGVFVSEFWDYNKTGKENAERYLEVCKERGVTPIFEQLLHENEDGTYSLQADGSTDNYWKLLVEGKMYNHITKEGAPQQPVKPVFNMDEAKRVLNEYEGGADTLPVADDVVEAFVKEYKEAHPDANIADARYSIAADLDEPYMSAVNSGNMEEAKRLVNEAAKRAGYNILRLYHGTPSFGFTTFDLGRGENIIFATSNPLTAETYSGETDRRNISDAASLNVDDLYGENLLEEVSKYRKKYKDYRLMTPAEQERLLDESRKDVESFARVAAAFIDEHRDSFNAEKLEIANRIVGALDRVSTAWADDMVDSAWNEYEDAVWDLKWMDESIQTELTKALQDNGSLLYAKNRMSDFMYAGDIYRNNDYESDYVFDNQLALELDAELHKGIYGLYGKGDNQLVIDANGSNWNQITPPDELDLYGPQRTRSIAEAAKAKGYDSVLFKNLKDNAGGTAYNGTSDVYMFFNPNQVKSSDPVAYADDGSVIPLSERFNPENDDIRYSLSTQDADGNILSDGQMEYFKNSQARDSQGRLVRCYRTTRIPGTELYDKRMYFYSDRRDVAQSYTDSQEDPGVLEYIDYLNITNPLILDCKGALYNDLPFADAVNVQGESVNIGDTFEESAIWDAPDTNTFARIGRRRGYDGIIFRNVIDNGLYAEDENTTSTVYVTFDASQMRGVDNLNPTENPDIRYSLIDEDEIHDKWAQSVSDIKDIPLRDPVLEESRIRYSVDYEDFIRSVIGKFNERSLTFGLYLDEKSVKKNLISLMSRVMNESGVNKKYRSETLQATINSAKVMFYEMKANQMDNAAETAWRAAERIVDDIDYNDDLYVQYKGFRDYLGRRKIQIPEGLEYDPSFIDFVRDNYGRMRFDAKGTSVNAVYKYLSKNYPQILPSGIEDPIDMLLQIDYALEYTAPYREAYTSEEYTKLVTNIAGRLMDVVAEGEAYRTVADEYEDRIKAMKARHEEALRKVKKTEAEKRASTKQVWKDVAKRWKDKYNERVQKDVRDRKEKKERGEHRDRFNRISDNYNALVKWVLKPDKDHYVPEEFRRTLAEVLQTLDLQTENSKKLEEKTGHPAQKTLKLRELKEQLEALSKKDGGSGTPIFDIDSYIPALLDALIDKLDKYGNSIDSLNAHDIKEIDRLLASIKQNIKNYNNLVYETKMVPLIERGNQVIEDQEHIKKRDGVAKKYEGGIKGSMKDLNVTSLTPTYLFDRLGPGMKQMYDELRYDGFDKYIRNEAVIIDRLSDILGGYYKRGVLRKKRPKPGSELQEWRDDRSAQDITLESGETVRMTVAQIMSLYCLYNRDQARLHMIEGGGIHIAPIQVGAKIAKAKGAISGKKYATEGRNYRISNVDAKNIIAKLTPEQKHIADQLQELMAKDMAKLGNEAHRMMYGYEIFDDPNYFPIKSHGTEIPTDINDINQVYEKIKSFGPAKPLDPKARNIIEIDDIFTITADHCNGMNLYNAYLVPISNFMKVYNYKTMDANVKEELTQAHGDEVMKYLSNFLSDLNGIKQSTRGGLNDIIDRALGRAKVAAVFGNIRVALQQPTAIIRALMEVDAKYFTPVLNVKLNAVPVLQANSRKEIYDEMYKYCPIALWKSWGYYDTYMGRDIEDVMMNNWSKREVALAGVYGKLDNATWSAIWQAVKAEQHDKHPDMDVKSEEFLKMCGRRASEVFDKTQVVDSTFHRSDAMRNKDRAVKALTAFMSEPTLTLNMLRGAFSEAHIAAAEGHKGKAYALRAKAIGVFLLQAAVVSAAQAFADAWRDKDPGWPGDDDDDDEKALGYWERWLHNFVADLFDQLHLENNVYLVKDVTPYINYILSKITEPIDDVHPSIPWIRAVLGWDSDYLYSNNNIVMSSLEDTARGIEQVINKKEKGEEYDKEWYDIIQKTLSGPGTLFGFPIGTLMKDFKPMLQKVTELTFAADGSLMDRFGGSSDDDSSSEDSSDGYAGDYTDEQKAEIEKAAKKHQESGQTESRDAEQMLFDAEKAAAGYKGEERNKKIWQSVTKGYTGYIEAADWGYIQLMRDTIEAAGGDVDYFDQQVLEKTKSSFKKSLTYDQSDEDFVKMLSLRQYLTAHGMTEEQISSEIVYKSEIAKDMKVAFRINDENAMREALQPLADAGLTQTDLERLWDNRNRMDLVKYKNDGGRFADRLKSTGTFIWPAQGTITSEFGYRKPPTAGASANHPAIDIGAPQGSPVVASDGGTVIYAGKNGGYGNSVGIKHDNGMVTYYNHLYSWSVKEGDVVAQGQTIAQVGSTGKSTGPHLDFKVLDANGEPVNPMDYLS